MDAAAIGISNAEAGELPKAYVVERGEDVTAEEIIEFVASRVVPHKKLREGIELIDTIPKSASGKILRRQLKSRD